MKINQLINLISQATEITKIDNNIYIVQINNVNVYLTFQLSTLLQILIFGLTFQIETTKKEQSIYKKLLNERKTVLECLNKTHETPIPINDSEPQTLEDFKKILKNNDFEKEDLNF